MPHLRDYLSHFTSHRHSAICGQSVRLTRESRAACERDGSPTRGKRVSRKQCRRCPSCRSSRPEKRKACGGEVIGLISPHAICTGKSLPHGLRSQGQGPVFGRLHLLGKIISLGRGHLNGYTKFSAFQRFFQHAHYLFPLILIVLGYATFSYPLSALLFASLSSCPRASRRL